MQNIPKIKVEVKKTCPNCKNNIHGSDAAYKCCKECLGSLAKINFEEKKCQ